ncbi:gliding motility-associated C-terminal domain-containing protein [Gramella sp. MAR_2010_147]|uniref:T9SS type B sorting domain-containing protein n=1 Tax=Gramella sp. MAR_2010_147 TaxID=1250205 RepID=UPI000B7F3DD0|nr:gliding motility-associated C-terminal domain-containing protein [Gramella sp. MAR_2010_147]
MDKPLPPYFSNFGKNTLIFCFLFFAIFSLNAQTKGLIYKQAAGSGQTVLDPNTDGYSSETNQGFFENDETESEIPYTALPSVGASEPDSDLGPGPDCKFTDLVKSENNNTVYTYLDGTGNLMFRFRLGGTAENSKGYSILIDTDQKFGASGENADPNYIPGNPGFEIEVVLRTNFGVGLYDIDGTVSPVEVGDAVTDRPYDNFAQKSIALSEICGDDDYFYDFYIPFADITAAFPSVTVNTPLRMVGNTVINPKAATGNNGISDLGGIDDSTGITDGLWEELINVFPPTSVTEIGSGATLPPRAACPSITGPIAVDATSITGTSSEVDGATIEVFRDDVSVGTTTVSAGNWTLSGLSPAVGNEVFSATAKVSAATADSTGTEEKSASYSDCNKTTVGATCSNPPDVAGTENGSKKAFEGTSSASGSYELTIYNSDGTKLVSPAGTSNPATYTTSSWVWEYGRGGTKIPAGVYYFTVTETGKCESSKTEFCFDTATFSSAPVISNTPILESDTSISGTATTGATITLLINGEEQGVDIASGGNWSFSVSGLSQGDELTIRAIESGNCSAETSVTVSAKSDAPIVRGEYCLAGGMTVNTVNGVSSEDAGSEINIYSSPTQGGMKSLEGTTNVQSNGSWSADGLNILIGRYITATAQNTGEIVSEFSNEVLVRSKTPSPNLKITSDPITEGDASITGEALASTSVELTIQLYMDGVAIEGATATVNPVVGVASVQEWTITGLDTPFNKLYAGGVATVTVTSPTIGFCESDPSNAVTVQCKQPASQVFSATTSTTVCQNETISFQVNDTEENIVYELIDQTDAGVGPAMLGTGSSISLTSFGLNTSVTGIRIRAQKIGIDCDRIILPSVSVTVNPLPAITLGANPIINDSETSAFISYTNAVNDPANYVLDFDSSANSAGFTDITTPTNLPASPIEILVPGTASGGTYNGVIKVLNTTTGCISGNIPFSITIDASAPPAINFTIDPINDIIINENTAYTGPTPVLSGDTPVGTVTYTLAGEDAGDFTINSSTGVVSMVARDFENPVDDDTNNTYELIVIATDEDSNTDSEAWAVEISDINEAPAITNNGSAATHSVDFAENGTGNVIDWDATDADGDDLTYSLSGADAALFDLDTNTGELSFKSAPDFEGSGDNQYEAIVTVSDGTFSDTQTLTVNVTDQTEAADFTIDAIGDATVNENSAYTGPAPSLSGDAPVGSVTYTITGADAALFEVNEDTGVVTMTEKDFENPADANSDNVYEVTLVATDSDGNTDAESWSVTVENVAEAVSFSIDPIADATVNENSAYTSETPSITGGPIGTVTYSLSGDDADDFTINASTGVVSMVARDFESPVDADTDNVYEVTITATDSDGNTDSESWSVSVTDQTEAADFTIDAIGDATVNENSAYTGPTPSLSGDAPIGSVTYTITGADAALFEVNEDTGVVTMTEKDFENPADANTDNVYEVTLVATDSDGNTDSESWSVTVENVAEAVSFSIDPIADATVNENSAYTSETPSITGGPIGTVTYSLSGDDADDFTINASTGVVSMIARDFEAPVDADTDNVYEVTITATDSDGNTDSESWSVSVTDQTEAADFTIDAIGDATVNENSAYTGPTPSLSGDAPVGSVTYTITGADAALFEVNEDTGVVTMTEKDFENPADANSDNVYEVTLVATDSDGNTDAESWSVTVENVAEAVSFSIDPIADASIAENSAYTSETPSITGGPIGSVTYSLSGDDADDFTINASTGVVSMIARDFEAPVDADTDNVYEVTITATDSDGNKDSESWSVSVTDQTEAADFTIDAIADATVNENSAYTGPAPSLSGDAPVGSVTYTITGADAALFEVNEDTGVVTMTEKDFENPADANSDNVYEVTLVATDSDGNTDAEAWSVTVENVAEAVSFSIDPIADASIAENSAYTSETPSITGGPIGSVTYSLSGDDADDFTINASTGVVSMIARDFEAPVDADTNNVYEVTITATDSDGNTDSESWSVSVTDQTEAADFTIDAIGDATVNENSAYTGPTPSLSGDAPVGSVTYTITGADAALFEVNEDTGVVTMTEKDFENPADANSDNVYEVTLVATDSDGNTDAESWSVTVENIAEAVSFSIDPIADATVNENSAYTSETPSITGGPIGTVTYSLSGDDADDFTINASTGVVSMIARDFEAPVDADTDNVYEVTITAADSDGNTDSESWSVSVTDQTEAADFTIDAIGDATVNENSAYTGPTPSLSGDAPVGSVTYTITGADAALFEVNEDTGVVTMTEKDFENPADANSDNVYEITLVATDSDGNTDAEAWSVTVENVAEAVSFSIDPIADASIAENSAYTSETPSITGGPIGSVTYSLSGDDADDFTINASTGVVSMVARDFESPVDADTDNVYEVTITATDSDGNKDSESWSVSVTDQTEAADFTIDAIADATVNENSAYTGPAPSLSGDAPVGSVTYTITGADAALFEVNEDTGVVTMTEKDFENPADANSDNVYEVTLVATDSDGNTDAEAWSVTVENVAEAVSFSIDPIADASIAENSAYTSETPSITGGPIGSVTYSLSGDDADDFTINASTGVVSMIARDFEAPVDADTDNVYEVTITATDSDGNKDSESWSVSVTDQTEAADFTIDAIGDATVNENSAYTGPAPSLSGDAPVGSVTYTITGADAALFEVNEDTGVVTMTEKDFENPADANSDNVYEVTLVATDSDGNTDAEAWSVTVENVAEAVSFSIDPIADASIAENSAYTSETPSITGGPIGSVTYSLSGDDADDFTINASTGVVSMIARDFEAPVDADTDNVYEVTITATDSDGNTDSESWSVSVTDQTEAADFTIDAIGDATVNENSAYTGPTPSLSGDAPVGSVTYTITGADAALFEVNEDTGVVTMTEKDFENPADANSDNVYEVTLVATDSDGNTDAESWSVTVENIAEAVSFSIDPIADATVNENSAYTSETPSITGGPIGTVTYSLSGDDADDFTINASTGVVSMIARDFEAPVDADTDNVYEVTITAADSDGNTDSESWSVSVTDQTEAADFTIDAIGDATVNENSAYTGPTPSLSGDAPVGSVTYTITGADAALFEVNEDTGVVTMTEKDFENPADANSDNVYEITLVATDSDGNTDAEAWSVTVENVAEAVSFSIDPIADASIAENSAYTSETPSITGGPIGSVTYSLSGDDADDFTINASTGVVSMVARDFESPVDADTDNVYEVTITATDSDGNKDSESWSVSVTDQTEAADFTIDAIADATVNENSAYTGPAPSLSGDAPVGSVTYTITGADAALFEVNEDTGVVTMTEKDFENPADANSDNVYEVTLVATDSDGNTDAEAWSVTVENVAEAVSFSIDPIADASIAENSAYTSETPSITGGPIGSVTYSLSGDDADDFTINASTGVVSMIARDFEAPVDADTDNVYEVTITATDSDGNKDSESWSVSVTDQTEAADFTIDAIGDATVNENSAYTGPAPSLSGDAPVGSVTYTITGADAALFEVNEDTGVVTMTEKDFENPADANSDNVYEVTLVATDSDGNTDAESWSVTVENIAEAVSFSIDPIADATVNENSAYTSETPSITGGPIGSVTYSLSGDDADDFTINASTGVVSMIARDFESPVDADTDNVYEVTITATDSDGNKDSESWSVSVTDQTEAADFTIDAIADATVNENSAYTGPAPSLSGDAPVGSVTYTITGADAALFEVNEDTGVVTMTEKDFENPADANSDNVYEVTLVATDSDGNTDAEAWSVTVENVAEAVSFSIDPIADASIAENSAYTSETPSITGGPIGSVTYSLSGDDADDFTINASTGVVSMIARDFEAPVDADTDNVYEVTITATDSDGNTDSESWSVSVTDQTEAADFTIDAIGDATVNENSAYTGPTPSLSGDAPVGSVTYTITGADAALFEVNEDTGVVTMTEKDFENPADANSDNVYEVTLVATDSDGNTDAESWSVTVENVAEAVSFSIDPIADASIAENSAYTSETPSITGGPIGSVTYSLSGDDADDFTINASTGVVSMIARDFEAPVDADTDNVYEVTITATDSDGNKDSESWSVSVTDQTEAADFTIDAIADATVNENSAYTGPAPSLSGDAPVGSVTYTITGADAALFEVNEDTGVVTMTEKDFENPADANSDNVYEVTLVATDSDGNTDAEAWSVTVENVAEAVSFSIDPIADASIAENSAYTSETPSITGGPIGSVTYSLSGDDADDFTINASTGVVSMIARDFEAPVDADTDNVYEVTITATDSDGNTDSESWSVSVTDQTEAADFTIDAIGDATVNENSAYTGPTPSLSGDAPVGSVTYTITGADAALFEVNEDTGVVTMTEKDFENPADANSDNVYEVTLVATDSDGNTDAESWSVTVENVAEAVSFSIDPIADATVNENSAYTSETPSITGGPIGTVTYSLSGDDADDFTINASTGVVSMIARDFEAPVDADTDNVYEVTITAADSDGNTDSESWSVSVTDQTEAADFTIDAIGDATVNENSAYTGPTPSLSGDAPVGSVTYTITGADAALFEVNEDTGVVTMTEKDFENPADANSDNVYEITLVATDSDGNTDAEAWSVSVENFDEPTTINDDNPSTNEDTAVDITVLANDTDVDDKSPVTSVTQPTNGVVSINDDGTVKYTPEENFNGIDSFTYTNSEGNTGTVTITVNSIDDEAIYTIADAKPINEYDNEDVLATVSDADGDIVNAVLTDGSLPAGVTLNADGSLSVENADLLEAGDYSFEITTTDENGGITVQTIVLSFGADSDSEAIYTIADAKPINEYDNEDILATVSDADGDIVNAVLTDGSLPAGVTLNADGSLSVENADLLEAGDYSFEITTTDENGGITVQTIVLSFGADSDSEAIYTIADAKPINEYDNEDILATVSDADGDIVNAVLTDGSLPAGVTLNADGSLSVENADLLEAGDYSFEITTTDENGGITVQTIVLSFGADSDSEAIYTIADAKPSNEYDNEDILATVSDADGDIVNAALTDGSLPAGVTLNADGSLSVENADLLEAGDYSFEITTTDENGGITVQTIVLSFGADSDSEAIYNIADAKPINEYDNEDILATVSDADGDIVNAALTDGSLPAGVTLNADGSLSVENADLLEAGDYSFEITTTDENGGITVQTIVLSFGADSDSEAIYTIADAKPINEYENNEVLATVSDADGDIVNAEVTNGNLPPGVILNEDGSLSVENANLLEAGDYSFEITTTDENGGITVQTIVLSFGADLDLDNDGLFNEEEIALGTDPENADSDNDGLTDGEEVLVIDDDSTELVPENVSDPLNICDPLQTSATCDPDNDGLINEEEASAGTDPNDADTDNDGLNDGEEVNGIDDPSTETIATGVSDPLNICDPNPVSTDCLEDGPEIIQKLSPNGDGTNDFFMIEGLELYEENTLEIFNRWGVLIYEAKAYGENGNLFGGISEGRLTVRKGEELPAGTYFYVLRYKDGEWKSKSGYLYLTR